MKLLLAHPATCLNIRGNDRLTTFMLAMQVTLIIMTVINIIIINIIIMFIILNYRLDVNLVVKELEVDKSS